MIQEFIGTITEKKKPHPTVIYLKVKLNKPIDFIAGQFLQLSFEQKGVIHRRPFSICSQPSSKKELEFAIRILDDGEVTPLIAKMKVGDKINLKGPLGRFTQADCKKNKIAFGSTGTGITPIRSMILDMFENKTKKQITLIYGSRDPKGLLFKDEFEKLAENNDNFEFVEVVSDDPKWKGKTGYITDHFDEEIDYKNTDIYLCGIPVMVESAHQMLLKKKIPEENIHFEKYVTRGGK